MKLKRCDKGHIFDLENDKQCPYCILLKDEITEEIDILENTIAFIREDMEPVVGWLVNISGSYKGMSYILKDGRNFIGSKIENDVCILGDDKIEGENHFSISYNNKQRDFVISPGITGNIIYVDKRALYETKRVENFSLIELGNTKLVLVQFCGNNFNWNNNE